MDKSKNWRSWGFQNTPLRLLEFLEHFGRLISIERVTGCCLLIVETLFEGVESYLIYLGGERTFPLNLVVSSRVC